MLMLVFCFGVFVGVSVLCFWFLLRFVMGSLVWSGYNNLND